MTSVFTRPLPAPDTAGADLDFWAEPLQAMYNEHAPALLAFAERFTTRVSAEDAVQETFLRAWRNLPRLTSDPRPLRPWLVLVLRRVLIDARRADLVRPVCVAEDTVLDRAVDGGYDRQLDRWCLDRAMDRLSPSHRYVLVQIFYRDTPVARVAAGLDIPSGTVRSRLYYALRALRDELSNVAGLPSARSMAASAGSGQEHGRRATASGRPPAPDVVEAAS